MQTFDNGVHWNGRAAQRVSEWEFTEQREAVRHRPSRACRESSSKKSSGRDKRGRRKPEERRRITA
jgi:hypothetical protein